MTEQQFSLDGEQIAFRVTDTRVQAHIQIQYQGAAKDFSWVVPVHSPTVPLPAITRSSRTG